MRLQLREPGRGRTRAAIGGGVSLLLMLLVACHGKRSSTAASAASARDELEDAHDRAGETSSSPSQGGAVERSSAPASPPEKRHGLPDRGIWADLDAAVTLARPEPGEASRTLVFDGEHGVATLYVQDWPVKAYPGATMAELRPGDRSELASLVGPGDAVTLLEGATPWPGDADDDGIVDPLDIVLGAKKTDVNDAAYDPAYVDIPFPMGDVPRGQGVCTDVVVRALRNAGIDLQGAVAFDIKRSPGSYPMVENANANIDHRRVKTLLPWFERHWTAHTPAVDDADDPVRAGDVVFMDTITARRGPDHIGVVSDIRGDDGRLLVINNWDTGATTDPLALLGHVAVTHRFRVPVASVGDSVVPDEVTRMIVVRTDGWDDFRGQLRRFERDDGESSWRPVGTSVPVVLGERGLGWGRGLHGGGAPRVADSTLVGPIKHEGDLKSPAGIFALGRFFVTEPEPTLVGRVELTTPAWRCVDDVDSRHYGRVLDMAALASDGGDADWDSAERMKQSAYRLAVTVEHNTSPVRPGAGSCIFLHRWRGADQPVTGCTAMAHDELVEVAAWAQPAGTVYVALPKDVWIRLRSPWQLPDWR